jgi:hypothetical protein
MYTTNVIKINIYKFLKENKSNKTQFYKSLILEKKNES